MMTTTEVKTVSLAVFVSEYLAVTNGLSESTNAMNVQFLLDNYQQELQKFIETDVTNGEVEKIGMIAPGIWGVVIPHDLPFGICLLTCTGVGAMFRRNIQEGIGVHLNRVDI